MAEPYQPVPSNSDADEHHHHDHHDHDHHDHDHHDHDHHDHDHHDHSHKSCDEEFDHEHEHSHSGCSHNHDGWRKYLPHSHSLSTRLSADTRLLSIALGILVAAFAIQLTSSFVAHSSLLAVEAVHTALDGLTVVISLISVLVAAGRPNDHFTYGYARAEVLSAFISVFALGLLCCKLFAGAVERLYHVIQGTQASTHVVGQVVFVAEGITLCANILMAFVLRRGQASLNIRALRAHVIADCIENMVVLFAGLIMWIAPAASIIDPIMTVFIVMLIAYLNRAIVNETVTTLMQSAPDSVRDVRTRLQKIGGVETVGAVHIWTMTSGLVVGSVVVYADELDGVEGWEQVRTEVKRVLKDVGCSEVTVQVSRPDTVAVREDLSTEDELVEEV